MVGKGDDFEHFVQKGDDGGASGKVVVEKEVTVEYMYD